MKTTKNHINQIIKEEISRFAVESMVEQEAQKVNLDLDDDAERQLKGVIEDLIDKLDELDLSVDFLASVMSGVDTAGIGACQTSMGRSFGARRRGGKKPEVDSKATSKKPE